MFNKLNINQELKENELACEENTDLFDKFLIQEPFLYT